VADLNGFAVGAVRSAVEMIGAGTNGVQMVKAAVVTN
jgi:hypothetical protein